MANPNGTPDDGAGFQFYTAGQSGRVTICTPSAVDCPGEEFRIPVLDEPVLFCLIIRDRLGQDAIFTSEFATDSLPPTASIAPASLNGSVVDDSAGATVTFHCTDNFSCRRFRYTASKDGTPADPSFSGSGTTLAADTGDDRKTGTASIVAGAAGDGVYTVKMIAQDEAGNNSSVRQVSFTVDTSGDPPPPATYTVTYNGNGNTGGAAPVDNNDYTAGALVTVLGQGSLIRTGFDFGGWNTLPNAFGLNYNPGSSFNMSTADLTLYAKWLGVLSGNTVSSGGNAGQFYDVATDPQGNSYVAGEQNFITSHDYGNGISLAGGSVNRNAVLVKYNSSGVAVWGIVSEVTPSSGGFSAFRSVAYRDGLVCVAGYQEGTDNYGYGHSVGGFTAIINGAYSGNNGLVLCYDSDGNFQWGVTTSSATGTSTFYGVAIDGEGNVYAAGISGSNSVVFQGPAGTTVDIGNGGGSQNGAIIRLRAGDGLAEWGDVAQGLSNSFFFDLSYSPTEDMLVTAGYQYGNGVFNYGFNSFVTSAPSNAENAIAVRYNAADGMVADALFAVSAPTATNSRFNGVDCDNNGNVYLAGFQSAIASYQWRSVGLVGPTGGFNSLVLKLDASGGMLEPTLGRVVVGAGGDSLWQAVTADEEGNFYTVGVGVGGASYIYQSGGLTIAPASTTVQGVLVKYTPNGTASWGKTLTAVSDASQTSTYQSIAVDDFGRLHVAGRQRGAGVTYDHSGISLTGLATGENSILLLFQEIKTRLTQIEIVMKKLAIILLFLWTAADLSAEVIYLKDGQVMKGAIINEDRFTVTVKTKYQTRVIERSNIMRILFGERDLEKIYIQLKDETIIEAFLVDQDNDKVIIRREKQSTKEETIQKAKISQLSPEPILPLYPRIMPAVSLYSPLNTADGADLEPGIMFSLAYSIRFIYLSGARLRFEAGFVENRSTFTDVNGDSREIKLQTVPIAGSFLYFYTPLQTGHWSRLSLLGKLSLGSAYVSLSDPEGEELAGFKPTGALGLGLSYEIVPRSVYVEMLYQAGATFESDQNLYTGTASFSVAYQL